MMPQGHSRRVEEGDLDTSELEVLLVLEGNAQQGVEKMERAGSFSLERLAIAIEISDSVATESSLETRAPGGGGDRPAEGSKDRDDCPSTTINFEDPGFRERLEVAKGVIGWDETPEHVRDWWLGFETEYQHRLEFVGYVAEELMLRNATIEEFFDACSMSKSRNVLANLHFLDYMRCARDADALTSFS
jgi:hypothetical protein